jgi:hypothetical protein
VIGSNDFIHIVFGFMLTLAGFKFCHITVFSCYKITRTTQPYQGGTEAPKGGHEYPP